MKHIFQPAPIFPTFTIRAIDFDYPLRQDATPAIHTLNTMFEYIFFDAALRERFVEYAEQRGVPCTSTDDTLGLVVAIPEDIPDDVADDLERCHDALEDEQVNLSKAEGDLKRLAGFRFYLPNGESRMLPVQTEMANRLLAAFNLEEIQGLLGEVANCTLNPQDERLCKMLAAEKKKDT
ncbi:MAG: hypothetical protein HY938_11970 [Nitrosomonadales bacterium]|nr:hypothetical protein [Nitrosomonadales bacterium]